MTPSPPSPTPATALRPSWRSPGPLLSPRRCTRRGSLATALTALTLTLGAPLAVAATSPSPTDPALQQQVGADERLATGRAVLERGHVDLGPRSRDGRWSLVLRDDTAGTPVWRTPSDVVLRVRDTSLTAVPEDPQYEENLPHYPLYAGVGVHGTLRVRARRAHLL